jgi:hypothetical protein
MTGIASASASGSNEQFHVEQPPVERLEVDPHRVDVRRLVRRHLPHPLVAGDPVARPVVGSVPGLDDGDGLAGDERHVGPTLAARDARAVPFDRLDLGARVHARRPRDPLGRTRGRSGPGRGRRGGHRRLVARDAGHEQHDERERRREPPRSGTGPVRHSGDRRQIPLRIFKYFPSIRN